jgi:hypothetical protein
MTDAYYSHTYLTKLIRLGKMNIRQENTAPWVFPDGKINHASRKRHENMVKRHGFLGYGCLTAVKNVLDLVHQALPLQPLTIFLWAVVVYETSTGRRNEKRQDAATKRKI